MGVHVWLASHTGSHSSSGHLIVTMLDNSRSPLLLPRESSLFAIGQLYTVKNHGEDTYAEFDDMLNDS
jgi:hypothetical protein